MKVFVRSVPTSSPPSVSIWEATFLRKLASTLPSAISPSLPHDIFSKPYSARPAPSAVSCACEGVRPLSIPSFSVSEYAPIPIIAVPALEPIALAVDAPTPAAPAAEPTAEPKAIEAKLSPIDIPVL